MVGRGGGPVGSSWSGLRTDGRVTREDVGRPIGGSVVVRGEGGKKRKGEEGYTM